MTDEQDDIEISALPQGRTITPEEQMFDEIQKLKRCVIELLAMHIERSETERWSRLDKEQKDDYRAKALLKLTGADRS